MDGCQSIVVIVINRPVMMAANIAGLGCLESTSVNDSVGPTTVTVLSEMTIFNDKNVFVTNNINHNFYLALQVVLMR